MPDWLNKVRSARRNSEARCISDPLNMLCPEKGDNNVPRNHAPANKNRLAIGLTGPVNRCTEVLRTAAWGIGLRFPGILSVLFLAASMVEAAAPNTITTYAGGGPDGVPALSVRLDVDDLAVDEAGNIYIASRREQRIFRVDAAGMLRIAAGTGIAASLGDGGDATRASFLFPSSLALDQAGNLLV